MKKLIILLVAILTIISCSSSRDDIDNTPIKYEFPNELLGRWNVEIYTIIAPNGEQGFTGVNNKGFYITFNKDKASWKDGNSESLNKSFSFSGNWSNVVEANLLLSVENGEHSIDINKSLENNGLRKVTIKNKRSDYLTYVFYIKK